MTEGAPIEVRPVADDQWSIVAWLWQAYRNDVAAVVHGLPYGDGRYQARRLDEFPTPDGIGYLAWRPHPNTGEDAPVGFALVRGLTGPRRSMEGFWVTPAVRREGVGAQLARAVLSRHAGPWTIAFQHDNVGAGQFWRGVADAHFGLGRWTETLRAVPGMDGTLQDHFIESV
jgi:predicted acetyltransferase